MSKNEQRIRVPVGGDVWEGQLRLPDDAKGLFIVPVMGRHHASMDTVVAALNESGLASVELEGPEALGAPDAVSQLAERLVAAVEWTSDHLADAGLGLGLMAYGVPVAAALLAAAELPHVVQAVVGRNGAVELAQDVYGEIIAPVLLVIGSHHDASMTTHRDAIARMRYATTKLVIVPGTDREERELIGPLTTHARIWMLTHLTSREAAPSPPVTPRRGTAAWSERLF